MTEAEWLASTSFERMLRWQHGKTTDRKFRLFAVACCRRIWHLLTDERSRAAVEVAEEFAEGNADSKQLEAARSLAHAVEESAHRLTHGPPANISPANLTRLHALRAAAWTTEESAFLAARTVNWNAHYAAFHYSGKPDERPRIALVRDIFSYAFHSNDIATSWLTGNVVSLAEAIYTDRAFDRMPILADALEDAGCTDAGILEHCRGGGDHVRGCWVVDLLLAKE